MHECLSLRQYLTASLGICIFTIIATYAHAYNIYICTYVTSSYATLAVVVVAVIAAANLCITHEHIFAHCATLMGWLAVSTAV